MDNIRQYHLTPRLTWPHTPHETSYKQSRPSLSPPSRSPTSADLVAELLEEVILSTCVWGLQWLHLSVQLLQFEMTVQAQVWAMNNTSLIPSLSLSLSVCPLLISKPLPICPPHTWILSCLVSAQLCECKQVIKVCLLQMIPVTSWLTLHSFWNTRQRVST